MGTRETVTQAVSDVANNPKTAGAVSTATTGIGLSTVLGWLEQGVGFAASVAGLMLALAMLSKVLLERKKLKLEIAEAVARRLDKSES